MLGFASCQPGLRAGAGPGMFQGVQQLPAGEERRPGLQAGVWEHPRGGVCWPSQLQPPAWSPLLHMVCVTWVAR